jgi:hypothetical protein
MKESILRRIKETGGLYGLVAETWSSDSEKSDQFIIECFEQCHNEEAMRHWGKQLVADIISYRLDLIRTPLKKLLYNNRAPISNA